MTFYRRLVCVDEIEYCFNLEKIVDMDWSKIIIALLFWVLFIIGFASLWGTKRKR